MILQRSALMFSLTLVLPALCALLASTKGQAAQKFRLSVAVVDENSVPVVSARVVLTHGETQAVFRGETDHAGRREFADLPAGTYVVRVEKEGFYVVNLKDVRVGELDALEIVLNHLQEFTEVVDVVSAPLAIDPTDTTTHEQLGSQEIVNLPYSTTRDIRNALPLMPGIVQDATGQVHLHGSATQQIHDQLDGFNITHPVTGLLELRVSTDAVRSLDVQGGRYSAEHGKGSGGLLSIATGMGDDRYRFSATDFIPSVQTRKGLHIENWTPRATFSGPLRKKKAWFYEALDGEYGLDIIEELPAGTDRNAYWRVSNLAKAQVNLTPANLLSAGFLVNRYHSAHAGLTPFDPLETTRRQEQTVYLLTVKEQSYLPAGALLDFGFAASQFESHEQPMGNLPYRITPEGTAGNFFRASESRARRLQWIANVFLPPARSHGNHQIKVGLDIEHVTYEQSFARGSVLILREDGTLARHITFAGATQFGKNNFQASGYAQDRWAPAARLLLEFGLRLDWDSIIREALFSPRCAATYSLARSETKISAGIGLFYDATNLEMITRPRAGERWDQPYASDGLTPLGAPIQTLFIVNARELKAPRFLNWSIGFEHKLPAAIYLRLEFIEKRGEDGLAYYQVGTSQPGAFELRNARRDKYDAVVVTLRRTIKERYTLFASYARSAARSNAVLDFDVDHMLFSQQAGGRLPWDAPNRVVTWGWLPLAKKFELAYSLEARDGGPFSVVNQAQQLVGLPSSHHFPAYFALNVHVERRFRLLGCQWALRAGFNNLTNRQNPSYVINNVDSPRFLTFGGIQDRAFTGRIRFLGRK